MYAKILYGCLLSIILPAFNILAAVPPAVRISEIHYDNAGTDRGEAIEVSGPAGTDISGWQVVLYNGNGGVTYDTRTLSEIIPATCGERGVVVINYPSNGIQNGDPDGIALVDASNAVVEFLSYGGVMTGTDGPANGLTSIDIGAREVSTEVAGRSLQRNAAGAWNAPIASTFGACNDEGEPLPPVDITSVTVSPLTATIVQGATQTFTASAFDASNQPISGVTFTWASSAPSVASVNANGLVMGLAAGDAQIIATAPNGIADSAALHVNAPPSDFPNTRFSEIHYDNFGTDVDEAIEIEGPAGTDLTGFSVVLYDGTGGAAYGTQVFTGIISATCGSRGVAVLNYPGNGIQNGSPDGFALIDAGGQVVEFLSYEGVFTAIDGPAAGLTSTDIIASEVSAAVGSSLQRDAFNRWQSATTTFGGCNGDGGPPPTGNSISFSGRTPSDPPLPVGFQDQLFATLRDTTNVVVTTTITWTSETPEIVSIDQSGVMTALAAGTAILRATAADGTTATYSLPTSVAVASATAEYAGNTEFGEPRDSDPSDDFIVRYAQYTASYNPNRGTPNWVSYDLDSTHFGAEDRCDCFTADAALPGTFTHLTTADYTGASAFHGYGIDRGHLVSSFDRSSASLDNALSYYFTNIVPQAADLNQGPWAVMENYLSDLAHFQDMEIYIIAGVAGNQGTLKNEGKIVIPTSTWKVAVILPRNSGLADIHDYRDLQVIAVNMPNEPGVRNIDWLTYRTTVDAIEQLTGYDLLALLPDDIEHAAESGTQPPIASITAPSNAAEGSTVALSAAASVDPNGIVESYTWNFGDGVSGTGQDVTHTYSQDGVYTVSLVVTDNDRLTDSVFASITVANVAPIIADFPGATLSAGQTYTAAGSFSDPGEDQWAATMDWGDGSAVSHVLLTQRSFALVHTYAAAGVFTVTLSIADAAATSTRTQRVTVTTTSDITPPVVTPVVTGMLGDNGWYRSNVAISWQVTDPQSPITSQLGCIASTVTRNTSGTTLICRATSSGGTTSKAVTIKRDVDLPIIGILSPFKGHTYKRHQNVIALYACVDLQSGVVQCAGTTSNLSRVDTSTPGTKSFTVNSRDRAGNKGVTTVQYTVR